MKNIAKIIPVIILIVMLTTLLNCNIVFAVTQTTSSNINSIDDSKYPGIKAQIQKLQKAHPNWNFKILYTGIDWNTVIANEYVGHGKSPRNLVPANRSNYSGDWICAICGNHTYDSGAWVCASETAIKYMMDPRNSLNESDVFQFQELTYDGYDKTTVNSMVKGTFLNSDLIKTAIQKASKDNNVSPYYIIARILQEQGTYGTTLTKGKGYNNEYVGYYNVFNIGATGSGKAAIITNGFKRAQKEGWTSLEQAIIGGSAIIAKDYIARGQNTLYLQKFDVDNKDNSLYYHQYMQNILAAQTEGETLKKTYSTVNTLDGKYNFIIPVYENMPSSTSVRPTTTSATKLTTDIVRVNVNNKIVLRESANGKKKNAYLYKDEIITRLEKATEKVNGTYWDKVMKSDGTIGYVARETYDTETNYKKYLVEIVSETITSSTSNSTTNTTSNTTNAINTNNTTNNSTNNATSATIPAISNSKVKVDVTTKIVTIVPNATVSDLIKILGESIKITDENKALSKKDKISTNNKINGKYIIAKLGDLNEDGKVDTADLLTMQKHLLSISKITNNVKVKSADINGDGKIDTADLLKIQKKLLGIADITF